MLTGVALSLALVACGFHLRGSYRLPEPLLPIHVEAGGAGDMAAALRKALRRQGTQAADSREAAASTLVILDAQETRRVLAVDDAAEVSEYEIAKSVRWKLVRRDGEATTTLLAPVRLQARRDYTYDSSAVLSKAEEERTLYAEMERALAQQILARVQSWSPAAD